MKLLTKIRYKVCITLLVLVLVVGAAQAKDGDLDTTFSADGVGDTAYRDAFLKGVVIQGDGKIVVAGIR